MNKDIKKIAIVRLSALGDIVNSAVVLQFIKKNYPAVEIDWITEEIFSPLLLNHPLIKNVHTVNLKKFKKEKSFALLKKIIIKLNSLNGYDLIIDIQGLIKSALVSRLLGKNTHGFDKDSSRESLSSLLYKTMSKVSYETEVVKRNSFLVADALNFEITDEMILNKDAIFPIKGSFELAKDKKNIAFVIGASWKSKIYPKELVVKICNELKEEFHIIWGDTKEKEDAEWIVKNSKYASLAPKLDLNELVSFISNMDLLIGNDTGPTHLAWAQNIASITIFGPTTTRMIYQTPHNVGVKSSSSVDISKIDKNDFSIKTIPYTEIVQRAKELLNGL